jgi:tRNA-dihydrouridine synthase
MYTGKIDIDYAIYIKNKFDIPVILSGDIQTKKDLEEKEIFDAVMIGRAAFRNIGIFSELLGINKKISFRELSLEHLDYYNKQYKRIGGFKKFLPIYLEHSVLDKKDRNKIYSLTTYEEIRKILEELIKS